MSLRKMLGAACAVLVLGAAGYAWSQASYPLSSYPLVYGTGVPAPGDFMDVLPGGTAGPNQQFVKAGAVAGVPIYVNGGAVLTAFTFTFANGQVDYFIQPAGTLATGTLTTAPNPGDGQRECFLSTQTQTALTWSANTNQTINNAPTAGVANTPICMTFQASSATWFRSP